MVYFCLPFVFTWLLSGPTIVFFRLFLNSLMTTSDRMECVVDHLLVLMHHLLPIVGNPPNVHVATPRSIPPCDTWHASSQSGSPQALSNPLPGRCSPLSGYVVRTIGRKTHAMLSHLRQLVTTHILSPAKRKDRNDDKSSSTISDSRLQNDDDSAITSGLS